MVSKNEYIKGFSLIEVVATIALLGMVAVPFMSIFITGNKRAIESREDLIMVNLAREKMEQIHLFSYETLDEDFYIFRDIYKDTIHNELKECDENIEEFYKNFTDIWTESMRERYPRIYSKLKTTYKDFYPIEEYELYPDSFEDYRRYCKVEEYILEDSEIGMKKVTVFVQNRKTEEKVEFHMLVSERK